MQVGEFGHLLDACEPAHARAQTAQRGGMACAQVRLSTLGRHRLPEAEAGSAPRRAITAVTAKIPRSRGEVPLLAARECPADPAVGFDVWRRRDQNGNRSRDREFNSGGPACQRLAGFFTSPSRANESRWVPLA